jgi:DNA polymerase-1
VSRDFSGQELRIMANLSGEKTWIDAFLNNEDIHAATAVALWGEENYNKDARKKAKTINFALLYGTGPASLGEQLGITKIEAIKLIDTFFKKLKDINSYLEECRSIAVDTKEISNPYGRKRRLKSYFNSDGVFLNSGKRKSFNFPIQSMGAEITKLALISIYKGLITNENYKDKVYFMNTIHDEINLSVRKDIVNEVAFKMGELMEHRIRDLPVPIITGLELGNSMGLTWKFNQDKTTLELTPEYSPLDKEDNE